MLGRLSRPLLFAASIEPLAALIRQNQLNKEIKDGAGVEHNILHFADDIMTFISLIKYFEQYGEISGHLIESSNSKPLIQSGDWPTELKGKFNFHWSEKGFIYLGINITPLTLELFKASYGKLIREIKADLIRWEVQPLSLMGRVETIRMNVLP